MPPHRVNLSIPRQHWVAVQERASAEGVSAAEWVRQAVYIRIAAERAREGDPITLAALGVARKRRGEAIAREVIERD